MTTMIAPTSSGALNTKVAAEIRAEAARQGISQKELAARMNVAELWVSRRLSPTGSRKVSMNLEELELFAKALRTTWLALLPRLDSNQEPAGKLSGEIGSSSHTTRAEFTAAA